MPSSVTPRARVRAAACVVRTRCRPSSTAAIASRARSRSITRKLLLMLDNERFYSTIINLKVGDVSAGCGPEGRAAPPGAQRGPARRPAARARERDDPHRRSRCTSRATAQRRASRQGGVVSHLRNEVEVSCLPKDLPEFLEIDVSGMDINDLVHLSDIKLPEGVEMPELSHGTRFADRLGAPRARRGDRASRRRRLQSPAPCRPQRCQPVRRPQRQRRPRPMPRARSPQRMPRQRSRQRPRAEGREEVTGRRAGASGRPRGRPGLRSRHGRHAACRSSPGSAIRAPNTAFTRHNAGFWFVDALARAAGCAVPRAFAVSRRDLPRDARGPGARAAQAADLHEPQRHLGARAGRLLKAPSAELLVVHDELDLPPGVARLKLGGGPGGHNGMRDVITHCGPDFWRLRLGIGHPGDKIHGDRLRAAARHARGGAGDRGNDAAGARCAHDVLERGLGEGHARLHSRTPGDNGTGRRRNGRNRRNGDSGNGRNVPSRPVRTADGQRG